MRASQRAAPAKPTAANDTDLLTVRLKTLTPILGGGTKAREVDEVDVIRVPTIRGHLRFWWRAVHGHGFASPVAMYDAEKALWGGTTDDDPKSGGRSRVTITVDVESDPAYTDFGEFEARLGQGDSRAYVLWTARKEPPSRDNPGRPAAQLYEPEVPFTLRAAVGDVSTPGDGPNAQQQVRAAIAAWVLFGGYGGRTRRGVGGLSVADDADLWLPGAADREAIAGVLGADVFGASPKARAPEVPLLAGATLHVGRRSSDATAAWQMSVAWLRDFRRAVRKNDGIAGLPAARPARLDLLDAFGLPFEGHRWASPGGATERLASPLVVKPLPLADGRYIAMALWLNRPGPQADPMRAMFFDWLRARAQSTEVAG